MTSELPALADASENDLHLATDACCGLMVHSSLLRAALAGIYAERARIHQRLADQWPGVTPGAINALMGHT